MFRTRASLASLLAVAVLAGCSTGGGNSASAPQVADIASDGRCQASGAEFAVGKQASSELTEQARKASGSQIARVIKPSDIMTLEYRSERLNLNADDRGIVTRVNCG